MTTETRTTVGVGDRLANGATVLQAAPAKLHRGGTAFLALWRDEFATWIGREDGTDTTWGHYFDGNLAAALADFTERTTHNISTCEGDCGMSHELTPQRSARNAPTERVEITESAKRAIRGDA